MTETDPPFAGCRILLVEDELAVALTLETALTDLGCVVVGPAARVRTALPLAGGEALDAALLDINLAGEPVWPVAEVLRARGVPFVLLSGYDQDFPQLQGWGQVPRLSKPVDEAALVATMRAALAGSP